MRRYHDSMLNQFEIFRMWVSGEIIDESSPRYIFSCFTANNQAWNVKLHYSSTTVQYKSLDVCVEVEDYWFDVCVYLCLGWYNVSINVC